MHKYFFILVLSLLSISVLLADTYYVDEDYLVETTYNKKAIQTAINVASSGDEIIVYEADDGYYEENLLMQYLGVTLRSAGGNVVVVIGENDYTLDIMYTNSNIVISGITFQNTGNYPLIHVCPGGYNPNITIQNCVFDDSSREMIYIERVGELALSNNSFRRSTINSCDLVRLSSCVTGAEISENNFEKTSGIALNVIQSNDVLIHDNEFKNCYNCIHSNDVYNYRDIKIYDNLIYDCTFEIDGAVLLMHGGTQCWIYNNTFISNATGTLPVLVDCNSGTSVDIEVFVNNIMLGFQNFVDYVPGNFPTLIDYNCYDGTIPYSGTHNITSDPEFELSASYALEYYSPCINTGDDDSEYDDPDGSRADMGWKYHAQDIYKWGGSASSRVYLWKCFPKLPLDHTSYTENDGDDIDVDEVWENWSPYPTGLNSWHNNATAVDGTYEFQVWDWTPSTYEVYSQRGYKLQRTGTGYPVMFSRGLLCEADVVLNTSPGEEWLGYFLPGSQRVLDAFPSTVTDDAIKIWTQNWCISRSTTSDPWTGTPNSCYVNYMDAVMITTVNNNHSFKWETPGREDDSTYRPVAEHFTFVDEIDYQPIYVYFEEETLPAEVAVYVNDVCKGAQVVEDTICQICAYILEEDEGEEIDFAFWYDDRGEIECCESYLVFNENAGVFKQQSLLTGTPGIHYEVSFMDEQEGVIPVVQDLLCYPNPFNPELTISFNIEETQPVQLDVYNVKRQKVKTLIAETFRPDSYNIVWSGNDNAGNSVSSGVYYIRLQAGNKVETSKAVLLK